MEQQQSTCDSASQATAVDDGRLQVPPNRLDSLEEPSVSDCGFLTTPSTDSGRSRGTSGSTSGTEQSTQSSHSSADSGIGVELDALHEQSLVLARDILSRALGNNNTRPPNEIAGKLRQTVDEMLARYGHMYKSMMNRIMANSVEPSPDTLDSTTTADQLFAQPQQQPSPTTTTRRLDSYGGTVLRGVADEMFADRRYNFGRIVALYAFLAVWAQHLQQRKLLNAARAESLAEALAAYIVNNQEVGNWMLQHDGWNGFMKQFPNEPDWEDKILKGLVITGVGLGLLAGFLALRDHANR